jgi:hypothetical protein
MTTPGTVAERIAAALGPYIGPFNAKVWVRVVAEKRLGLAVEALRREHVAGLLEGLNPSLRTMMGRAAADELVARIAKEVG